MNRTTRSASYERYFYKNTALSCRYVGKKMSVTKGNTQISAGTASRIGGGGRQVTKRCVASSRSADFGAGDAGPMSTCCRQRATSLMMKADRRAMGCSAKQDMIR